MRALLHYDWPGNVRELKHAIERMAALYSEGAREIELPSALRMSAESKDLQRLSEAVDDRSAEEFRIPRRPPVISLPESERRTIVDALAATSGERGKAARLLGIGRTTLYRKIKEYGLD